MAVAASTIRGEAMCASPRKISQCSAKYCGETKHAANTVTPVQCMAGELKHRKSHSKRLPPHGFGYLGGSKDPTRVFSLCLIKQGKL